MPYQPGCCLPGECRSDHALLAIQNPSRMFEWLYRSSVNFTLGFGSAFQSQMLFCRKVSNFIQTPSVDRRIFLMGGDWDVCGTWPYLQMDRPTTTATAIRLENICRYLSAT